MKIINFMFVFTIIINSLYGTNENLTVIGVGRLGICAALCFEKAGFNVLGVDINEEYVKKLNDKTFESPEPAVSELLKQSKNFKATCCFDEGLKFSDVYLIYVDTPTTPEGTAYDHKNLNKVLSLINAKQVENKHIVICCTVFPGYIENEGKKLIKDCKNTTLNYNPEFIAQGSIIRDFLNPSMVLIGQGSIEAGDIIEKIHNLTANNHPEICRMSPISAEITKLSLNCFITTKIAFANSIADIADSSEGANKYDILKAIGCDSRINEKCLMPGYGYGGPCFPRDNRALNTYAKQVGIDLLISRATDQANKLHAEFMTNQLLAEAKDEYTFENVTYKENCLVPIIEESQKLEVAAGLASRGMRVVIRDNKIVCDLVSQKYGTLFEYCCD